MKMTLLQAAILGNVNAVESLLKAGVNTTEALTDDGWTAIQHAACIPDGKVLQLLITHGADVNFRKRDDETALHIAATRGYDKVVGLLLNAGADPNLKNNSGHTALDVAVQETEWPVLPVIKVLLTHSSEAQIQSALVLARKNIETQTWFKFIQAYVDHNKLMAVAGEAATGATPRVVSSRVRI